MGAGGVRSRAARVRPLSVSIPIPIPRRALVPSGRVRRLQPSCRVLCDPLGTFPRQSHGSTRERAVPARSHRFFLILLYYTTRAVGPFLSRGSPSTGWDCAFNRL